MDISALRRLATEGTEALIPAQLRTLADWCNDWAVITGDARYAFISEALHIVDEGWEEQGIPVQLIQMIDDCLVEHLSLALSADDASEGAHHARELQTCLGTLPWSASEWRNQGWFPE